MIFFLLLKIPILDGEAMEDQFTDTEKIPREYQLYTLNDIARIFKTTKRTLYRLIEKGELKTIKFGGNHYVKKEILEEIINGKADAGSGKDDQCGNKAD